VDKGEKHVIDDAAYEAPRWLRDLMRFLPLKSQFVISGNVRDLQLHATPSGPIPQPLVQHLVSRLREHGYACVVIYDPASGFRVTTLPGETAGDADAFLTQLGLQPSNGRAPAGIDLFAATLERIVHWAAEPIALVADFASRLVVRQDILSAQEHQAFTRALILSHQARTRPFGHPRRPFFNSVIWVVDKEGDLPDWLLIDNPRLRHIPVPKPDHHARRALATVLIGTLEGARDAPTEAIESALQDFIDNTEGLLLVDLTGIAELGRGERLRYDKIADAVRRYKIGVTEDPWQKIDRRKIVDARAFIGARVKGQDHAVVHMLDIVKRAITGVGAPRRGGRPRGIAFLAGPTGVGKTELAKTITSLLFGDDNAYIRFDMSEFSAEHADQRLIGAPPGYVGYDVGGELTNAIREKPFSVVLFDEIEKAHPRILDKFLQILDDGVLTSGRGDRVYFSEAFIIFTSNLGIYKTDAMGMRTLNVSSTEPYEAVRTKVREEIEQHFKVVLNRPELLNRIGENIIIFDFIRTDVAQEIFDGMVRSILDDLAATQEITVDFSPVALETLRDLCLEDLSNGGRGIRNKVEVHLVNPLARALFEANSANGGKYCIDGLDVQAVTNLHLVTI
jgi:energy-coupling factor transporter ATP-binding protein EcfA2